MKTQSYESYHERRIFEAERTIERAKNILRMLAMKDQLQLFLLPEAQVIQLRPDIEDLIA